MTRRRLRDEQGMTTVQVAILFPAVLIWLMLIVQYGLWWQRCVYLTGNSVPHEFTGSTV